MRKQKEIVEQMRAFMEQNQMTQTELAKFLGFSPASISKWLNTDRTMKYDVAVSIMEKMNQEDEQNGN